MVGGVFESGRGVLCCLHAVVYVCACVWWSRRVWADERACMLWGHCLGRPRDHSLFLPR